MRILTNYIERQLFYSTSDEEWRTEIPKDRWCLILISNTNNEKLIDEIISESILNNEPTIYIISDTILIDSVINTITEFKPDIIITNSGNGIFPGHEKYPVIMDEFQTIKVAKLPSNAKIVAVHLESIDFNRATRKSLREFADKNGISKEQLLIPNDGETIEF